MNGGITDEALIEYARNGDSTAIDRIIERYRSMVKAKSRTYFLLGADSEDLIQEGMIGLYKAIREYSPKRQTAFSGFAEVCVKRQILTAIKAAARQKHIPLNSYIPMDGLLISEHGEEAAIELQEKKSADPEEIVIGMEEKKSAENRINTALSRLERRVLAIYLDGHSYAEIAEIIGKDLKTVDNALSRIRKKLGKQ